MTRTIKILATLAVALLAQSANATPFRLAEITYPFKDQGEYWINSEPLSDQEIHGKPVLVMFWTYSCYNCSNSIEWINHVHDRFADQGLLVLGIHTPEFAFEKVRDNVVEKTAEYAIEFPVMMDNDFIFWKGMRNKWWPSFYLADRYGNIQAALIGETHIGTAKSEKFIALIKNEL